MLAAVQQRQLNMLEYVLNYRLTGVNISVNAALIPLIDALLPQTQCGKCGHEGCLPYAQEIAVGGAINKCPPGGSRTIAALAALLNTAVLPLDPANGVEAARTVAFIREDECIGCTKCIQACPVDAILGASKRMHTVIINECTGCDLCLAPCPVDCIDMLPLPVQALVANDENEQRALSAHWRQRYYERTQRLERQHDANIARRKLASASTAQLMKQAPSKPIVMGVWTLPATAPIMSQEKAKSDIAAAVARAKARKAALKKST